MSQARRWTGVVEDPILGEQARALVFPVLAEIGWADGRLSAPERSAARGAASALGLAGFSSAAAEAQLPRTTHLGTACFASLTLTERCVLVACAAWMALADNIETRSETAAVRSLGERAGLSKTVVDQAVQAARWVRTVTASYLDWRQELLCLLDLCRTGLVVPAAPSVKGLL